MFFYFTNKHKFVLESMPINVNTVSFHVLFASLNNFAHPRLRLRGLGCLIVTVPAGSSVKDVFGVMNSKKANCLHNVFDFVFP